MAEFLGSAEEWKKWGGLGIGASLSGTVAGILRGAGLGQVEVDTTLDIPTVAGAVIAAYAYREMDEGFMKDVCGGVVIGSIALLAEPFTKKLVEGIIKPAEEGASEGESATELLSTAEQAALMEMARLEARIR